MGHKNDPPSQNEKKLLIQAILENDDNNLTLEDLRAYGLSDNSIKKILITVQNKRLQK